jgi:hypothetical protein
MHCFRSDWESIELGVPQGSVLFWSNAVQYICINDVPKLMDKLSHTILYADDTNIIVTSTDCNDLHKTVNVTLQILDSLFRAP